MAMLVLPAELTHSQANTCLGMLREAVRAARAEQVLVDASALTRFDSSALAVLLECRRDALHDGKPFLRFVGISGGQFADDLIQKVA